jgi:hypothetical protein
VKKILGTALVCAMLSSTAFAQPSAPGSACDRACLEGFIDQYLDALVAHAPAKLPLANNVRFTEDTLEKKVGEGLWQTASKIRPFRQDIIDVRQGIAGSHVVVEENGSPSLFVLRMKIVARKIAEIETMVVRSEKEGMIFAVDSLTAASDAMNVVPPPAQRNSREEAIKIAEKYPAGLKAGGFVEVDAQFAQGAYRFENGQRMAGPGCKFRPPSCEDIKAQKLPKLAGVTYRVAAVDEELGIVWMRLDFGAGSTFGGGANSLIVWEAFKVYDDKMHAVEAFMEVMPAGSKSGWE